MKGPPRAADRTWTKAGVDDRAVAALSEGLGASELWSLLLDVLGRRAAQRTPPALLQQWERDGFTRPTAESPSAAVVRESLDHPYYDGVRFMIDAQSGAGGDAIPLIDGGAFDWLGKLTSNRRLALVASGMGAQRAAELFRVRR